MYKLDKRVVSVDVGEGFGVLVSWFFIYIRIIREDIVVFLRIFEFFWNLRILVFW